MAELENYRDPLHNNLAAEVQRLEDKVLETSNPETQQRFQDEANQLSLELARYLAHTAPGDFRVHRVYLSQTDFAPFKTQLSWTSKSFQRLPQRRAIVERIFREHRAQINDIFLVEEVDQYNRPTGQKAILFLDLSGPSGGTSAQVFIIPRLLAEFIRGMGLTRLAAQKLYFGKEGPQVFTNERTRTSAERKL